LESRITYLENQCKKETAQLSEASRMISLSLTTTVPAHEINNPLANIQLIADNLLSETGITEEIRAGLMKIREQADRIHKLVRHFRNLAGEKTIPCESVSVNDVIRRAFEMFSEQIESRNIDIDLKASDEKISPVYANPSQLEQVFINLISNAKDAMESRKNGVISVKTTQPDDMTVIYFSDTGVGIPREVLPHIFEPLFTTKDAGKGTGLGLWLCHNTVQQMKGYIEAESEEGKGTTFIINLPTKGVSDDESFTC